MEGHMQTARKLMSALSEIGPGREGEIMDANVAIDRLNKGLGRLDLINQTNKLDQLMGGAQAGIGVGAAPKLYGPEPWAPPPPAMIARERLERIQGSAGGGVLGGAGFRGGVGGMIGYGLAGIPGAVGGAIIGRAAASPANLVRTMAVAERLASRAAKVVAPAMESFGKQLESPRTNRRAQAVAAFFGNKSAQAAFSQRKQELARAQVDLPQRMAQALGPDALRDPHLAMSAQAAAQRAIAVLNQHMPQGFQTLGHQPPPSTTEIHEYAAVWAAVTNPTGVLGNLPAGTATPAQMQAIQTVYPKYYEWAKNKAMQAISTGEPSVRQMTILDQAFGLGDVAGPTYSLKFAQQYGGKMGDSAQAQNQQQQTRGDRTRKAMTAQNWGTLTDSFIGGPR
jgi:hypothetical protein